MKNLFIFLILSIFCLASFTYNFSLSCERQSKNLLRVNLECVIKENNKKAGHIFLSYFIVNEILIIDDLKIKKEYRERNLSNILLYHGINFAKNELKLEDKVTLQLTDDSSVTKKTGKPHYVRYGFEKAYPFFKMLLGAFLKNEQNIVRYYKKCEGDTITGINPSVSSGKEDLILKCLPIKSKESL